MSVTDAAESQTIQINSKHVYPIAPVQRTHVRDRASAQYLPLGRRRSDWDDQFTTVVRTQLPRLQRLARRVLHCTDLADDAVQEALFSLWNEGRMPVNLEGWLGQAVVLRSLHLSRSRRRRRSYEEQAGARRPERDPCGDVSRVLEVQEVRQAIAMALETLPEQLRAVVVLRAFEDQDYEAIARGLQIPLGTVRSRLNRARRAIHVLLRPHLNADDHKSRNGKPPHNPLHVQRFDLTHVPFSHFGAKKRAFLLGMDERAR
jgi:RNA polymerase sigma-70 factor (ECF subfamily)